MPSGLVFKAARKQHFGMECNLVPKLAPATALPLISNPQRPEKTEEQPLPVPSRTSL